MRNRVMSAILLVPVLFATAVAQHDGHDHGGESVGVFGQIKFPTSCPVAAQKELELGIAELHSFEYETASAQFHKMEQEDPGCAMAYWGEAMALYHQLWNHLSKDDLTAGWGMVQKAQAAKETSAREQAYVAALAALYKPGTQTSEERATAYSLAMEKVHTAYPEDEEAAVFYALSLLGAEPPSDTSLSYPKKAVAILNGVLAKDPDHPGVTHYIIHACDNPKMAPEALAAARQYAKIAPDSAHAVHMPSHIFARLGLWQESIDSNLAAIAVAKQKGEATEYALHPMDFLMYAYLQTGQDDKARAVENEAVKMTNAGFGHGRENYYFYVQSHFPAMLAIETKDWLAAENLKPTVGAKPGMQSMTYWAQAVGAGHLRDVPAAKRAVKNLDAAIAADKKANPGPQGPVDTDANEAHAWLAFAQGDDKQAIELLQPVIEYQDSVGKGEVELPAREMYAEMLLELHHPNEALEQYRLSLNSDPNRFNALYGAGRAAEMAGQRDDAIGFYRQLLASCKDAPDSDELAHARKVVAEVATAKE
jgi:tetratricopeptide (TPR) repeat protein